MSTNNQAAQEAPEKTKRIVVELYDESTGRTSRKAFEGRFIIGDEKKGEEFFFDQDSGIRTNCNWYSVAVTKAGRLAVIQFNADRYAVQFEVFDDSDALRVSPNPETLIQAVGSELGIEIIKDLDI